MSATEYIEQVRMNDYVGSPRFAWVTWATYCVNGKRHSLGLLSHTCTRCGATPTTIVPDKGR